MFCFGFELSDLTIAYHCDTWLRYATEATYQRQDGGGRQDEGDESLMMLLTIFVVIPLLGFTVLIVFIYRRVADNKTSYHGSYNPLYVILCEVLPEPQVLQGDAGLRFLAPSLHCESADTELEVLHRTVCLFTSQLSLVLISPTDREIARLS